MTTYLPDWAEDNFVNQQDLMIDLFAKVFPSMNVGSWKSNAWLDNADEALLLWVRLPGGHVDYDKQSDTAFMQCSAHIPGSDTIAAADDAWKVIGLVRAILLPMQGYTFTMNDGYTAIIRCVDEVVGAQMLTPDQMVDDRVVPVTFKISVGLRSRKRYGDIISGL